MITHVPLKASKYDEETKFYCDFDLDLSTLSDDELLEHDQRSQYCAAALNANILNIGGNVFSEEAENRLHKMRHLKAIYNAYRQRINVERGRRAKGRPTGRTLQHYFMISAKKNLPKEVYNDILEQAKAHHLASP